MEKLTRQYHTLRLPLYLAGALFIVIIIRLLVYYPYTPEDIVCARAPEKADAIVFLEGEHYIRIDRSFDLAEKGYADVIFCPGLLLKRNIDYIQQRLVEAGDSLEYLEGGGSSSTYGDAIETRRFIKGKSIESILLVTSPYHSYRAWWVFSKVLHDVEVISVPVPFENNWFKLEDVVKGSFQYKVYRREQIKFALSFLLYGWREYF